MRIDLFIQDVSLGLTHQAWLIEGQFYQYTLKKNLMNQMLKSSIRMLLKFIEKKAHTIYRSLYNYHYTQTQKKKKKNRWTKTQFFEGKKSIYISLLKYQETPLRKTLGV